jgi:hypothetical protein
MVLEAYRQGLHKGFVLGCGCVQAYGFVSPDSREAQGS